jgi:hypothetical protein
MQKEAPPGTSTCPNDLGTARVVSMTGAIAASRSVEVRHLRKILLCATIGLRVERLQVVRLLEAPGRGCSNKLGREEGGGAHTHTHSQFEAPRRVPPRWWESWSLEPRDVFRAGC